MHGAKIKMLYKLSNLNFAPQNSRLHMKGLNNTVIVTNLGSFLLLNTSTQHVNEHNHGLYMPRSEE